MPRKKRLKSPALVPHLAQPSAPYNRSNKQLKKKRKPTYYAYRDNPCCSTLHTFIQSVLKNLEIITFLTTLVAWIATSYYLVSYLQTTKPRYLAFSNLPFVMPIACTIATLILYSYTFLSIALAISPKGHDVNAYQIGRGKFHPLRVFQFMYTCCQLFHPLSYAACYFRQIASFNAQCRRQSLDGHLDNMAYTDYSKSILRSIISKANNRVLESIENEHRLQRSQLQQKHYDDIVKHDNIASIRQTVQAKSTQMVSLFNVHYDKQDAEQYANIFLPPSLSLSLNYVPATNGRKNGSYRGYATNNGRKNGVYQQHAIPPTPAVIFLVGGAWGSCDMTFSASAASSFVQNKIAFIYPTYTVFPDGNVQDMLNNINAILTWLIKYASVLNINPNHIAIVGQSAGAHLGALSILKAYQKRLRWLKRVRLFCGLAGPYDIGDHYRWESSRGIENLSPMGRCMKGVNNFEFYSPTVIAQELRIQSKAVRNHLRSNIVINDGNTNGISQQLPHFVLIHTKPDYIVPCSASKKFAKRLNKLNAACEYIEYSEGTHYDTLFGLCAANNIIFNKLITDITSRLFIVCKQYNENPFNPPVPSASPSPSGFDEKETIQDQPEEFKLNEYETSKSPTERTEQAVVGNAVDEEEQEDAFYEEEDEEVVSLRPRKSINQQNAAQVGTESAATQKREEQKAQTLQLPRAQSLHLVEAPRKHVQESEDEEDVTQSSDDEQTSREQEEEERMAQKKSEREEEEEKASTTEVAGCTDEGLFDYQDISADIEKNDEAVELMKHLLSDMEKALHAISSLNHSTAGEIEKIEIASQSSLE